MHNVQVNKISATEYRYRYADINAKCAFPIKKLFVEHIIYYFEIYGTRLIRINFKIAISDKNIYIYRV